MSDLLNTERMPCIEWFDHKCKIESAKFKLMNIESEWTTTMSDLGFFADGKFSSAGDVIRGIYLDNTKSEEDKIFLLEGISADFSTLANLLFGGKSEATG